MADAALTVDDVLDVRAYERSRDDLRVEAMAARKLRRVDVGPLVTFAFENRTTVLHQVHEMVRAEQLVTDDAIAVELEAYNPLVSGPGRLCATVFVTVDDEQMLSEWLSALVGLEGTLVLRLADGTVVRAVPDERHAASLVRATMTPAVHFVRFALPAGTDLYGATLAVDHPRYRAHAKLPDGTASALAADTAP